MISDTWIQYGALGVLSVVLVGIGYWLRWYTKETQAFIRDLVDKITEEISRQLQTNFHLTPCILKS